MKKSIRDINVSGKKVLVRVDFNVPLKNGVINDDNRIVQALPTIKYLLENNAKVILFSHLGKINFKDEEKLIADKKKNDMVFVANRLKELVENKVVYCPSTRGEELEKCVNELNDGEILLMQNTRYEKGETKNDETLASYWASLCDIFVMDAFGSAHRAHASTYGVPSILNNTNRETAVGFLVEKEINALSKCLEGAERPYVAVLGGSKVSDKIKVIEGLLNIADKILIGGGMAYTFLKAQGYEIGNSLNEEEQLGFAKECLEKGKGKLFISEDFVMANDFSNPTIIENSDGRNIKEGFEGLDIGVKTREIFTKELQGAKTVFWNGPMGVFENPLFEHGTVAICKAISELEDCFTVIGGGDSASAAAQFNYKHLFSHVSTGGGASLEMIENNGVLPGVEIIQDK